MGRGRPCSRWPLLIFVALMVLLVWSGTASAVSASVVYRGPSSSKWIALTFDDNTSNARALATLRALEKHQVPATLFLIGSAVSGTAAINSEIVEGMGQGLFEVGDHSWSHPVLKSVSTAELVRQIGGGTDAFRKVTGARTVPLFRPPYGSTNSRVAEVAASEGFEYLVLWDVDPRDWAGGSASSIANHVISHAHNGAIVVMHLSAANTAAAIPTIVGTLRAKGYEFVTVSTMLKGDRLFLDVADDSDVGTAVARLVQLGFLSGYDTNYFGPEDFITRAQVAKVITLVGGLHTAAVENADSPTFADVVPLRDSDGNALAYPFDYIEEVAAASLVAGSVAADGTSNYRPNETITRVQLAQILARMVRELKGYGLEGAALVAEPALASTFSDVPVYASADVALVTGLGLMSGRSAQEFGPWAGALRAQVALAMTRYLDLPGLLPGG
ncbi:MAG: hypothetical protein A2133_10635 [Actinobacteria bacterium RBG_16_64_13]|nr:MAG: hypothetical protein A2133_10635 [Actinobacteria bacterium RBG_16_64_13]